jgi:hypothetical protein
MGKFLRYEECPKCVKEGRDRAGDNLGVYSDGGAHCFSCGFHRFPRYWIPQVEKETNGDESKTEESGLPRDFTREVPVAGWKWLLQWGLPYSYWKPYCGYSPSTERLVFPIEGRFSVGRHIPGTSLLLSRNEDEQGGIRKTETTGGSGRSGATDEKMPMWGQVRSILPVRKWYVWGSRTGVVPVLQSEKERPPERIVLVEDLISAHKVAQVYTAIPLFGTNIDDYVVKKLQGFNCPVTLWLDDDQYALLPKKINRLQSFLEAPVGYVRTDRDPKHYDTKEIQRILG